MPSTMMHLLAAHDLWPDGGDGWFLGNILPDAIDTDRAFKDHLHFRDLPEAQRPAALRRFAAEKLDLSKPFDLGVYFHFFLDLKWDAGPQKRHKETYTGECWFLDYRREITEAGYYIARTESWARPLWERLRRPEPRLYENTIGMPEKDILAFLEYHYGEATSGKPGPSAAFPPALVDAFCRDAAEEFARTK